MQFKISQEALKKGLSWIQNVAEKKTTKPILTNVLIEASDHQLRLHATDLEVGVRVELSAQVVESGRIAVPAKSLGELVKEIQAEEITFSQSGNWLEVKAGRSKSKLAGLSAEEFPPLPAVPNRDFAGLPTSLLKEMIDKVLFAVLLDNTKPTLGGILFKGIGEKKLLLAATDGHRMSYIEKELSHPIGLANPVILPRKGVVELQKMLQEDGVLPFLVEGRNAIFRQGEVTLFIRLIDGVFPDYQKIIPQGNDKIAMINRAELLACVRRVSLFAPEHNRGVKFTFSSGHLDLLCANPDVGEAKEELECDYQGEHFSIGFNYRYFLDVLTALKDEKIRLELGGEKSPCIIKSEVEPGFLSLVMPMRI